MKSVGIVRNNIITGYAKETKMVSISQITSFPITNVQFYIDDWAKLGLKKNIVEWIESTFGSENEYNRSRVNTILLQRFRLLFRFTMEISCKENRYFLDEDVVYHPSRFGPPDFFYLRAGEEVSATVTGIDEKEAGRAISDALINSAGDLITTWKKLFENTRNPTETVISNELKIVNRLGMHARAVARLAITAREFKSEIYFLNRNYIADSNILDLLTMAAYFGSSIEILASGPDAKHAVKALSILVSSGFNDG